MRVKTIVHEDFVNYKKPAMFIGAISCNGKCCTEGGFPMSVCQNDGWRSCAPISMEDEAIVKLYLQNPITTSIVFGGLEPIEQFGEMLELIRVLRKDFRCHDDVVIYTGYYPEEIGAVLNQLRQFDNIIVKFGRYIPNIKSRFDEVLGVQLASENQYAMKIS